ncbi:M10 family metallopeptidase C-terminal domain-containing protein [Microvirga subterranea]|uniref:Putative secreted protein (Type I secretion substrate) n=1 Tax=Microvirga subterranea TaxID=186651 RepID=A0A370HVE1_9HYPH|nr:alpha/beta hydrolase fold domain-containing protein [Microvirga subterranea]RDI62385.1 putative secreted protein (type I secretion substrate) [Microvirga subterranea]
MTRPTVSEFLQASAWTYTQGSTPASNPFKANGQQMTSLDVASGFYGAAFLSASGQVIVAFEGTDIGDFEQQPEFVGAQILADLMIYRGDKPPAFDDALAFTKAVIQQAAKAGISKDNVFVTGHSLGGGEAAYVAAQLGLGGATFGAPGIDNDLVPSGAVSQLTNYVEWGDPVGNYSAPSLVESNILFSNDIARFGPALYVGSPYGALLLGAANSLLAPGASDAQEAAAIGLLGEAAYRYHLLTHYTAALNPFLVNQVAAWAGEPTRAEFTQILSDVIANPDKYDAGQHLGDDVITGGRGKDTLLGFAGNDRIAGGRGADKLFGGADADAFVFKATGDSTASSKGRDTIYDFSRKQGDVIDLTAIDASRSLAGDQDFTFIGRSGFHGVEGELRYSKIKGGVMLQADVNGDAKADFAVVLKGISSLAQGDFLL